MSENKYIRELTPWPLGTPLPDNAQFVFYAPDLDSEFTATPAQLGVAVPAPVNTTPAAPSVAFDPTTRILSASHALGTGELEYRHGSAGAVTPYAALSIDGNAHAAAEWQFRVKAATGRNASAWADSPAIGAAAAPVPTITSLNPTSGAVGASVTITGTNLSGATALTLNGVSIFASITANTATSITFTVPAGAATGVISVTTPAGTGTSTGSFTVTVAPIYQALFDEDSLGGQGQGNSILPDGSLSGNFAGDPNATGEFGGNTGYRWSIYLKNRLPATFGDFRNYGKSGQTAAEMLADYDTQVLPLLDATTYPGRQIVFVGGGINDLLFTNTYAADLYATKKAMIQAYAAAGHSPITATLTPTAYNPQADGFSRSNAQVMAEVDAYNALVRAGQADMQYAGVIDWAADPILSDLNSGSYRDGIKLHFSDAGNERKALVGDPVFAAVAATGYLAYAPAGSGLDQGEVMALTGFANGMSQDGTGKITAASGQFDASARSAKHFEGGAGLRGFFQFKAVNTQPNGGIVGAAPSDGGFANMAIAAFLNATDYLVLQNGASLGSKAAFAAGAIARVELYGPDAASPDLPNGGSKLYLNETLIFTNPVPLTFPLIVDIALSAGGDLTDLRIGGPGLTA